MYYNPLEQFEVLKLVSFSGIVGLTNFGIAFIILELCRYFLFIDHLKRIRAILLGLIKKVFFNSVKSDIKQNLKAKKHPHIFIALNIFMAITFTNSGGLVPYSTTVTSHLLFTFIYAASIF